jgi:hypothetical protein
VAAVFECDVAHLGRLANVAIRSPLSHPTIRLCLIKVATRVTEIVTRIRIALPTTYPYQLGFAMLAGQIVKLPP